MIEHLSAVIMVDQRRLGGGSRSTVGTITDIAPLLRLLFSRAGTPYAGYSDAFSFNMPAGMCPACEGLGEITDIDMNAFLDPSRSLNEGALLAPAFKVGTWHWQIYAGSGRLDPDQPVREYTDEQRHTLLHSTSGSVPLDVGGQQINASYEGAAVKFRRLIYPAGHRRDGRTNPADGRAVHHVGAMSGMRRGAAFPPGAGVPGQRLRHRGTVRAEAGQLLDVLATFDLPAVAPVVDALTKRGGHLVDIGLGYLSLDRRTGTLSGG